MELVKDMSTHSFILSLIRFTNIYGIPSYIYSDKAKSSIAGCNLIEHVFPSSEFTEHFQVYNIKHVRIPLSYLPNPSARAGYDTRSIF